QVHAPQRGSGLSRSAPSQSGDNERASGRTGRTDMQQADDKETRRALMDLDRYPASDLILCLEHEVREIRARAVAELKRRSEIYEAADGLAWMWQNAMKAKAYGGGAL